MATPAPEKLTTLQVESFTDLIQTNPVDWQGKIKVVKEDFPEDFASTIGLDTDLLDNSQFDNYVFKKEQYKKLAKKEVTEASATTGLTILTASTQLKSFAVRTENSLTNFLSAATKLDDALFDLPGEKLLQKKNYKVNSLINFPGH